jgi:HlyD family secretion protein
LKKLWLLLFVPVIAVLFWAIQNRSAAPRVVFAKARRQTISSTISTNGKIEPIEYVDVRVEAAGLIRKLFVHLGDKVRAGQQIAQLSQAGLTEDLQANEARAAQAQAELETLKGGGRSSEQAEIQGNLARIKEQRAAAQRNFESLDRLQKLNAATQYEVDQARQAVGDLDTQIQSLSTRRTALVGRGDIQAAQERLREAQANVQLSRSRIGDTIVHSPMAGTVYDLPAHPGAYLNIGDPVASIGKLDPVRVRVYVDEPELGRIAVGQPVRITWDALPGKQWNGTVDKKPAEVIPLGSRQVGEVLCTIDNPSHELVPGTNVNAFILTQVVRDTLTIPKTAVRRENGTGVFLLQSENKLKWQPIRTGVGDALRVQVEEGVREGEAVAQPSDVVLKDGMTVTPVIQ